MVVGGMVGHVWFCPNIILLSFQIYNLYSHLVFSFPFSTPNPPNNSFWFPSSLSFPFPLPSTFVTSSYSFPLLSLFINLSFLFSLVLFSPYSSFYSVSHVRSLFYSIYSSSSFPSLRHLFNVLPLSLVCCAVYCILCIFRTISCLVRYSLSLSTLLSDPDNLFC
uniref:Uncharacterized protein n=1 Tax=Cacopsylla melanoneura TaxID=428564 RepID=A0A8D9BNZ9_9HEMI